MHAASTLPVNVPQIVVLGAGYAGVAAANRILAAQPRARVTVVTPRPDFVERIRLHQEVAGSGSARRPLTGLLHPDATIRIAAATRIDADACRVRLDDGTDLGYDHLVYAIGSRAGIGAPGAAEHAHRIGDVDAATALRAALERLAPRARVVVVGGGATGVETATELAESHPGLRVTLVAPDGPLATLSGGARRAAARRIAALDVAVVTGATVVKVGPADLLLADGRLLDCDLAIWAAGFEVPPLARDSGLPTDERGRLLLDATLCIPGRPEVAGAGDAVTRAPAAGGPLRMSCQAALPMGAHAGAAVLARLEGRTPTPFAFRWNALCVSLGREAGLVQLTHADDSPARGAVVTGRGGRWVKETICRLTVSWLRRSAAGRGRLAAVR